jgi:tyrosine-specific transport protein
MNSRIIGVALLVAGTTIGAGMLALPIVTGPSGYLPAAFLLIAYWAFMLYTSFLLLEATLSFPSGTNLVTMARDRLGITGQAITWIFYLFLLYALTTAYLSGSAPIVLSWLVPFFGPDTPEWVGFIPMLLLFGYAIYQGTEAVDIFNRWMMIGLGVCFLGILLLLVPHLRLEKLLVSDWSYLPAAISLVSVSFGYHIIIPSIVGYLDRDVKSIKKALFIGSLAPLLVYLIWEGVTLSVMSSFTSCPVHESLEGACLDLEIIRSMFGQSIISQLFKLFSFFLIATSFLGVSLSLFDFLADGFKIPKSKFGRISLYVLTFTPPLIITLQSKEAFLGSLEYAGAFGVVTLLAILPALLVYQGRKKGQDTLYQAPGGLFGLLVVVILSLAVILHEIYVKL